VNMALQLSVPYGHAAVFGPEMRMVIGPVKKRFDTIFF